MRSLSSLRGRGSQSEEALLPYDPLWHQARVHLFSLRNVDRNHYISLDELFLIPGGNS